MKNTKFLLEPIGGKGPSLLSNDIKRSWLERTQAHDIALFCPAQAYPVPAFRLSSSQSS